MPQIFHRSTNTISRVSIFGSVFVVAGVLWLMAEVQRSPWMTDAYVAKAQPIQFSQPVCFPLSLTQCLSQRQPIGQPIS